MRKQLARYKYNDSFLYRTSDQLSLVCNAPKDASGIYLIYAVGKNRETLIYIGISGRKGNDGNIIHRQGGIRGRFLAGKQFGDRRSKTWPLQMKEERINALHIYWWITHDGKSTKDFPRDIEEKLLRKHFKLNGCLPKWNNAF